MPFAISLKCPGSSGDPVRTLWEEAAAFEAAPSMTALGYPPHLTLAVYESVARVDLEGAVAALGADLPIQHLTFTAIRSFPGSPLVLWLAPERSPALERAHRTLHEIIDPALCHPHYRPGAWVPHCTLAMRVAPRREQEALAWAAAWGAAGPAAFTVAFDVLDCVAFPPVKVLGESSLRPSAP